MTPHEVRAYLEPFGKVGRIFLSPDAKSLVNGRLASKDPRDRRKIRFTDGWVEFERKKAAKTAALALNGSALGGKKTSRFHDDIWNIKYLSGFQWSSLTEQVTYERAVRKQRLRTEITQARKANTQYMKQSERARELEKMEETRAGKRAKAGDIVEKKSRENIIKDQMDALRSKFKQRKPVADTEQ